jgi:hypothetical protein
MICDLIGEPQALLAVPIRQAGVTISFAQSAFVRVVRVRSRRSRNPTPENAANENESATPADPDH